MAAAVLGIIVLAVGLAVQAAQKASLEGQKTVLGAMAADDMMSELRALEYAQLPIYDGVVQDVGEMQTLDGDDYPETYWALGRSVMVENTKYSEGGLGAEINGRRIVVAAFDENRVLVELECFVPEPAS
jgi:hypothetical protein